MEEETTQQVVETVTETGKVGFGIGHISKPTPEWARWVFRIYLYVASFAMFVITTNKRIKPEVALEIIEYISISLVGVHGLSKMVGVDISQYEKDAKDAFKQ